MPAVQTILERLRMVQYILKTFNQNVNNRLLLSEGRLELLQL